MEQAVGAWLVNVLAPEYLDKSRTYTDVIDALTKFPSLRVKTEEYVHETGQPQLLICLHGTIPASYAGATYRIPVEIWLFTNYPKSPPVAYVRPTATMVLNPSNYVDANGKCYHPSFANWNPSLLTLTIFIETLSQIFGANPPVYARPAALAPSLPVSSPSANQQRSPNSPISPRTAIPLSLHQSPRMSASPISASPMSPNRSNHISPQTTGPLASQYISPQNTGPSGVTTGPPKPPMTPLSASQAAQSPRPNSAAWPHYSNYEQHNPPPNYTSNIPPPLPNYPSNRLADSQPTNVRPAAVDYMSMNGSSVSEQAPAIPPNPERILAIQKLHDAYADVVKNQLAAEQAQEFALTKAASESLAWLESAIGDHKRILDNLSELSQQNTVILDEKIAAARTTITQCEALEEPDVDAVVNAPTVVDNQLYDLLSEDRAIDDTLHVLAKALDESRIDLDQLMKHSRTLAREQFMKRALATKIAEETGLLY